MAAKSTKLYITIVDIGPNHGGLSQKQQAGWNNALSSNTAPLTVGGSWVELCELITEAMKLSCVLCFRTLAEAGDREKTIRELDGPANAGTVLANALLQRSCWVRVQVSKGGEHSIDEDSVLVVQEGYRKLEDDLRYG